MQPRGQPARRQLQVEQAQRLAVQPHQHPRGGVPPAPGPRPSGSSGTPSHSSTASTRTGCAAPRPGAAGAVLLSSGGAAPARLARSARPVA
ncbi:hypothetical protein ACFQY4_32195 [Catellatospora bangladeshensis]|uniref:hypothetical protein n=1 Tax=Catellatospora bangladeshensis TaxID=310355 RepID=UPI00360F8357